MKKSAIDLHDYVQKRIEIHSKGIQVWNLEFGNQFAFTTDEDRLGFTAICKALLH
jgi:asparagine synthetase A